MMKITQISACTMINENLHHTALRGRTNGVLQILQLLVNDTSKFWLPGFPILQLFTSFGFIYSNIHSSHFCIVLCPQRIIECPPAKQTHSKHLFQIQNMTTSISELFIFLAQQVLDEKKTSKASQK